MKPFPEDFLFGTSQSGHQIEGENFNSDWWRWEQRPGRIAGGGHSKEAAAHYQRFEEDLDLAKQFSQRSFLFSIEWARIQPKRGQFDENAITHYRRVLQGLHARGIEPIVVMHHVTLPGWFARRYGWRHKKAPALFEEYARRLAEEFAPLCRWWIPVREPMHWFTMAYFERAWPPASRRLEHAQAILTNMARAHARTYHALRAVRKDVMVGAAIHARHFEPLDEHSAWDVRTSRREEKRCNRLYLDALTSGKWPVRLTPDNEVKGTLNFIGVSYYGRETVRFALTKPGKVFSQLTGENGKRLKHIEYRPDAEGFAETLQELGKYGLPLLVTANGIATKDDAERCRYLVDHVSALREAMEEGLDVLGYCYRSLLDGFEWEAGYTRNYGLVHVHRTSQARTPNPSALLYKELCDTGTISAGTIARYCTSDLKVTSETRNA